MKSRAEVMDSMVDNVVGLCREWSAANNNPWKDALENANLLLKAGRVHKTANPNIFEVDSQNTIGQTYTVNGTCDCPSARYAYKGRCKHRIAVSIFARVSKQMQKLVEERIPHEHRLLCGHGGETFSCWQTTCHDTVDTVCETCQKVYRQGKDESEMMKDESEEEEDVAVSLPESPSLDFHRMEYEEAPPPVAPVAVPCILPEAPASLNIEIPLPGGGRLMYTARGADDTIIQRLPGILAQLEAAVQVETEDGWVTRIKRALFPGFSGK